MVEEILGWAAKSPKATEFTVHADRSGVEVDPTAQAWFAEVQNCIADSKSYVLRKSDWVTKAGRPERPISFSCVMVNTREEDLADFFLGVRQALTVSQASVSEERFGIRHVSETFTDATLQVPDVAPAAKVVLTARSSAQIATLECDLYTVRPWLPETSRYAGRVRFKSTYFDLVIRPDADGQALLTFNFPSEIDLARAAEEVRFFHVLHTAEALTVTHRDKHHPFGPLKFRWTDAETSLFDSLLTTYKLLSTLGLRTRAFRTAARLRDEALAIASAVLGDERSRIRSLSLPDCSAANLPMVVLSPYSVTDGQNDVGFIVRFDGTPRVEDIVWFDVSSVREIDRFAYPSESTEPKLTELLKTHADAIENAERINVTYIVGR